MTMIVCLDDRNGMLFNGRRQSRDRIVYEDIVSLLDGDRLWLSAYSAPLFSGISKDVTVWEPVMQMPQKGSCLFLEDLDYRLFWEETDALIIYRWGRIYPSDTVFSADFNEWTLLNQRELKGNSHDIIVREVYLR